MTVKTASAAARRSSAREPERGAAPAGTADQLSYADRVPRRKDARAAAPLESHSESRPGRSRDPVGLLFGQAGSRVPELVPVRHGRMLVSPFTFYRGAVLPMDERDYAALQDALKSGKVESTTETQGGTRARSSVEGGRV